MPTLLERFKEFVDSKPADEHIDNSCAWYECAIGEFAKHVGYPGGPLTRFATRVCGGRTELYWLLDNSHFKTYGELQAYLAKEVVL